MPNSRLIAIEQRIKAISVKLSEIDDLVDAHFRASQEKAKPRFYERYGSDSHEKRSLQAQQEDSRYSHAKAAQKQELWAEREALEKERAHLNQQAFGGLDTEPL